MKKIQIRIIISAAIVSVCFFVYLSISSYYYSFYLGCMCKRFEITDSFCVNGDKAVVFIRNTDPVLEVPILMIYYGMDIDPDADFVITENSTGKEITVTWTNANGEHLEGKIAPGKIARFEAVCGKGNTCMYEITYNYGKNIGKPGWSNRVKTTVQC